MHKFAVGKNGASGQAYRTVSSSSISAISPFMNLRLVPSCTATELPTLHLRCQELCPPVLSAVAPVQFYRSGAEKLVVPSGSNKKNPD